MSEQAELSVEFPDRSTSASINNVLHVARNVPFKIRLTHYNSDIRYITIELLVNSLEGLVPVNKCLKHINEATCSNVAGVPVVLQLIDDNVVYRNQLAVMTVNELINDISIIATCCQKCHGLESKETVIRVNLFYESYNLEDPNGQIPIITLDLQVHIHAAKNSMTSHLKKFEIGRSRLRGRESFKTKLEFDSKSTALEGVKSVIRVNELQLKYAPEDKKALCEAVLESNKETYNTIKRFKKEE